MTGFGARTDPYTQELAEGVFAYVQPDGSWFLNNTGIVVGDDSVVMIDHAGTERRGRALMDTVGALGGVRPVRSLVNTHHHADHTFGNYLVPPGTSIIGHELCREEVVAAGTAVTGFFDGPDWGDIRIRPPEVTFTGALTLRCGSTRIELRHFGIPAHTTNDVVAHLPDQGIAFCGDLLFTGGTPFAVQGSIGGWLAALDHLERLNAPCLVPGHGPVGGVEQIAAVRNYLEFVADSAASAHRRGMSPLEAARELDLGEFAGLTDAERIVGNLHRAYVEIDDPGHLGTPLPVAEVFGDMRAYLGGPLISKA
ncbi:MBL fold metallo-hydrolase [Haloechinothrix sp. YIM 98757]|uniref:MBL fold metallo-hydrolase n=1 Tax=Haloechinothrix aidingensis TaxID=2752311 RepID=A0A838AES8_9PSEU|nr:MBL fold metallo-hydrolase [Haloechinothrix aidingensis]MBA0127667.1 MBL fold metallo-hydrolase [Haloechinothrix aidingensis]